MMTTSSSLFHHGRRGGVGSLNELSDGNVRIKLHSKLLLPGIFIIHLLLLQKPDMYCSTCT